MRRFKFISLESDKVRYENFCLFYLPIHLGIRMEKKKILPKPFLLQLPPEATVSRTFADVLMWKMDLFSFEDLKTLVLPLVSKLLCLNCSFGKYVVCKNSTVSIKVGGNVVSAKGT